MRSDMQDAQRSGKSSSSSNPKAAACSSALGALINLLGDAPGSAAIQQVGCAAAILNCAEQYNTISYPGLRGILVTAPACMQRMVMCMLHDQRC